MQSSPTANPNASVVSFRRRQPKYTGNRCVGCNAPLQDALRWLCDRCAAWRQLALAVREFRRCAP
jgi:hypothetical protein